MKSPGLVFLSLVALAAPVISADAQLLRLGVFDLDTKVRAEGIYTTNVEGERKSDATAERQDYYLVLGVDFASAAPVSRGTRLMLDSGFAVEKHFNRPDLDNSESPFGRLSLESQTQAGHYTLGAHAAYEKTSESADDLFVPNRTKTRDVNDTWEYGAELEWKRDPFQFTGSLLWSSERHEEEQFKAADQDEFEQTFGAVWLLRKDLSLNYDYTKTETTLLSPNAGRPPPEDGVAVEEGEEGGEETTVDETETITIDWQLPLLKRPVVTYSLGVEKEKTAEDEGEWELTHTISADDEWDISSPFAALSLSVSASYQYEKDPEANDITFEYGALLTHQLGPTAEQRLSAQREPARTLGSTSDTDQKTFEYQFLKKDLFMYNLNLGLTLGYEISTPMGDDAAEEERIWTRGANLEYTRLVTRKIYRTLAYTYDYEKSELEDEPLDEHRLTLSYRYQF